MVSPTSLIVAPNSGAIPGDTTIQGQVSSTPEPAALSMIGGAFVRSRFLAAEELPAQVSFLEEARRPLSAGLLLA